MKIPNTDIDIRVTEPPEKIELRAHSGVCKYCGGLVKMMRDIKTAKFTAQQLSMSSLWSTILCRNRRLY